MKFENFVLHSLFGACLLVCVLTIGAMITVTPTSVSPSVAGQSNASSAVVAES